MIKRYSGQAVTRPPRGAADLMRAGRGVGAVTGDYCPGGCPVDAVGRVTHVCGCRSGTNAQVFTTLAVPDGYTPGGDVYGLGGAGSGTDVGFMEYTVTCREFCPEFFALVVPAPPGESYEKYIVVEDIVDASGDSMLLGTNDVIGEFFDASNKRGNKIEGCCVKAGLKIRVNVRNTFAQEIFYIQGSFWGGVR